MVVRSVPVVVVRGAWDAYLFDCWDKRLGRGQIQFTKHQFSRVQATTERARVVGLRNRHAQLDLLAPCTAGSLGLLYAQLREVSILPGQAVVAVPLRPVALSFHQHCRFSCRRMIVDRILPSMPEYRSDPRQYCGILGRVDQDRGACTLCQGPRSGSALPLCARTVPTASFRVSGRTLRLCRSAD